MVPGLPHLTVFCVVVLNPDKPLGARTCRERCCRSQCAPFAEPAQRLPCDSFGQSISKRRTSILMKVLDIVALALRLPGATGDLALESQRCPGKGCLLYYAAFAVTEYIDLLPSHRASFVTRRAFLLGDSSD